MAAAFAFDCELDPRGDDQFKIYCTSSQHSWQVKRKSKEEFDHLRDSLAAAPSLLGKVEIPPFDLGGSLLFFETFINKLISNAFILREPILHEFLDVPVEVRTTLEFITERPDGAVLEEGFLLKHYKNVEREPVNRYFKMTEDNKGATLRYYDSEHSHNPVGATRVTGGTKVDKYNEGGVKYGLKIENRGRVWILEGQTENSVYRWISRIQDRIDQAGVRKQRPREQSVQYDDSDPVQRKLAQLRFQNVQVQSKVDLLTQQVHDLEAQVDNFRMEIERAAERQQAAAEAERGKRQEMLSVLQENYDQVRLNLQSEMDRLEREKEAQPALAAGKKGLMGWLSSKKEDSESEEDQLDVENFDLEAYERKATEEKEAMPVEEEIREKTEQDKMKDLTEAERNQIAMIHRHFSKHTHTHVHVHRHTHIHVEDEQGAIDHYPRHHHFEHILTHTSEELQVKKSKFG